MAQRRPLLLLLLALVALRPSFVPSPSAVPRSAQAQAQQAVIAAALAAAAPEAAWAARVEEEDEVPSEAVQIIAS